MYILGDLANCLRYDTLYYPAFNISVFVWSLSDYVTFFVSLSSASTSCDVIFRVGEKYGTQSSVIYRGLEFLYSF